MASAKKDSLLEYLTAFLGWLGALGIKEHVDNEAVVMAFHLAKDVRTMR